jgi:hypothetical protein
LNNLAPIVLFVYNRPKHTAKTLEALQENELASVSELFVYSDQAKNSDAVDDVETVRNLLADVKGFKRVSVFKQEVNVGLANSIISGVSEIVNKYGKVIVLEDDLVTSPYFLKFMNEALDFYESTENIFSITGFSFSQEFMEFEESIKDDIYLNIRPMSWSWATWKSRWQHIDWDVNDYASFIRDKDRVKKFNTGGTDLTNMLTNQMGGKLDSWYVRWSYHAVNRDLYTVYPKVSLVNNLGHDGTGVHCGKNEKSPCSHKELSTHSSFKFKVNIKLERKVISKFNRAFDLPHKRHLIKLIKYIGIYPLLKKMKSYI